MSPTHDTRRAACVEAELECATCVQRTAALTALLCPDRDADEARRVFFEIYPQAECLSMAGAFVRSYRDAVRVQGVGAAACACA